MGWPNPHAQSSVFQQPGRVAPSRLSLGPCGAVLPQAVPRHGGWCCCPRQLWAQPPPWTRHTPAEGQSQQILTTKYNYYTNLIPSKFQSLQNVMWKFCGKWCLRAHTHTGVHINQSQGQHRSCWGAAGAGRSFHQHQKAVWLPCPLRWPRTSQGDTALRVSPPSCPSPALLPSWCCSTAFLRSVLQPLKH